MKKEVADRDAKLSEVALLDNVIENFKRVKECESFSLEEILEKSSNRVKKHLKIIIENKLEKEDLQSSLKIILHRLDGDSIWGEIINMISKLDNKELVEKIITELGGGIEKPVHSMSESDSAPSSSETEDNDDTKLEPKRIDFQKVVDDDPKKQTATELDSVAKKKIKDKKVKAIETRQSKLKEALEDQAAIIMETGDDTLFNCYDDIIEQQQNIIKTLTDAPTTAPVEEGGASPIIRKNKPTGGAPRKNKKVKKLKIEAVKCKTYSLGGLSIRRVDDKTFALSDLFPKTRGEGGRILDNETGELVKKIPCGFYPSCPSTFTKDSRVIGGTLIKPEGHRRIDKLVYICADHQADSEVIAKSMQAETGIEGKETKAEDSEEDSEVDSEESEIDELTKSLIEEEENEVKLDDANRMMDDETDLFSQSMLAK